MVAVRRRQDRHGCSVPHGPLAAQPLGNFTRNRELVILSGAPCGVLGQAAGLHLAGASLVALYARIVLRFALWQRGNAGRHHRLAGTGVVAGLVSELDVAGVVGAFEKRRRLRLSSGSSHGACGEQGPNEAGYGR